MALADSLRLQLLAIRAQIDATLALDAELAGDAGADDEDGGCPHPKASRIPAPAMGHPDAWACGICHETFED